MNLFNKRNEVEYTPPLDLLDTIPTMSSDTEVMFTLGEQEIVKQNDKYFLGNAVNPNISKEISRDTAYELIQIKNQQKKKTNIKFFED